VFTDVVAVDEEEEGGGYLCFQTAWQQRKEQTHHGVRLFS